MEIITGYLDGTWNGDAEITPIPDENLYNMFEKALAKSGIVVSQATLPTSEKTLLYTAFAVSHALKTENSSSDTALIETAELVANDVFIAMEFVNYLGFDPGEVRRDFNDLMRQTMHQAWMIGNPIDLSKLAPIR